MGKPQFYPAIFDIDISVCMSCQICVEVCPFEAIKMDKVYELSRRERFDALLMRKGDLAKSNNYYHSIHPLEADAVDAALAAAAAKKKPAAPARQASCAENREPRSCIAVPRNSTSRMTSVLSCVRVALFARRIRSRPRPSPLVQNRSTLAACAACFFFSSFSFSPLVDAEAGFLTLHWRNIGPYRGGRTRAIAGVPSQPNVFYCAQVNGGVFKTTDYGRTWQPIFDDQPTGSVGALAVSVSNPKVIYVGSGEGLHRPDLSVGDGIYKSTDAGKTWTHLGLARWPADRADRGRSAQSRAPARGRFWPSLWA